MGIELACFYLDDLHHDFAMTSRFCYDITSGLQCYCNIVALSALAFGSHLVPSAVLAICKYDCFTYFMYPKYMMVFLYILWNMVQSNHQPLEVPIQLVIVHVSLNSSSLQLQFQWAHFILNSYF